MFFHRPRQAPIAYSGFLLFSDRFELSGGPCPRNADPINEEARSSRLTALAPILEVLLHLLVVLAAVQVPIEGSGVHTKLGRSGETNDTTIADLGGRHQRWPDQVWHPPPQRANRQVQPPAAHRRGARGTSAVWGARGANAVTATDCFADRGPTSPPKDTSAGRSRRRGPAPLPLRAKSWPLYECGEDALLSLILLRGG